MISALSTTVECHKRFLEEQKDPKDYDMHPPHVIAASEHDHTDLYDVLKRAEFCVVHVYQH